MVTEHEAWLKLTIEEPLDPALPICDTHHHLWDRPGAPRYLFEELLQDISGGHNIVKTVFVDSRSMYRQEGPEEMMPVGEVEFVQGVAAQSASGQYGKARVAAGIVGFVDLTLGKAVAPVIEALMVAGRNRFRGIRNMSAWDASADIVSPPNSRRGLLSQPKFREGFPYLREYGLSFDAFLYHPQLSELVDLARAFPDIPIILNHIGGLLRIGPYAGKREEVFQQWQRGIAEAAACPNVVVKLGGLGAPRAGFDWHERTKPPGSAELAEAMAPYLLWCIEQFGVDRCMFESNFPPDRVSYSYTVLWNAFKRVTKGFSAEERAALFYDTAMKVYRL
ncbi:MAG: amidohydrolase family protein [Chloroflexi bacterium]|nr:amidohydrolase family protein [Chloroflexota bacterium]